MSTNLQKTPTQAFEYVASTFKWNDRLSFSLTGGQFIKGRLEPYKITASCSMVTTSLTSRDGFFMENELDNLIQRIRNWGA